ncbi:MAG: PHP domain-containing protein [Chloroflexota bacterium]|nr:PHP domain-containing protein [Chloroflexota bacterium]
MPSFLDLHCHTGASFDSLSRPGAVVSAAAARGLTHLAITDHERIDGALAAQALAPAGLTVIVGEEIRTRGGDMIGLYLREPIPPGLPAVDTARRIREQGGLVGLPHPFARFRFSGASGGAGTDLDELLSLIDYVEVHNARAIGGGNARAAEMAAARRLAGVAVSDAHTVMEVGVAYTIIEPPIDGADELRAALTAPRLVVGRGSYLVRAGMPFAKLVQRVRGNRRVRPAGARDVQPQPDARR